MHEEETVTFRVDRARPCRSLWQTLRRLGFTLEEDVFVYHRREKSVPPWQHDVYVEIDILRGGEEVFDEDGSWDTVSAVYLLARLPEAGMTVFVEKTAELATELRVPLEHRRRNLTPEELFASLRAYAAQLTASIGAPGSEAVAIYIRIVVPAMNVGSRVCAVPGECRRWSFVITADRGNRCAESADVLAGCEGARPRVTR